jgi:hypothetical protein
MRRRVKGFAAGLALVFCAVLGSLLVTGDAAAAAPPIVIGDCSTSVQGTPGQPVSLSPGAVLGVVVDGIRAVPLVGPPVAATAGNVFAGLPPIPIGALPTGTGYITGGTIANQVAAQLRTIPLLGPLVLEPAVRNVQAALTGLCGVTVTGVNQVAAPVQDGTKSVADASQQATGGIPVLPGTGGNPGTGLPGGTPAAPGGGGGGSTAPPPAGTSPNQPVLGGVPYHGVDLGRFSYTARSPMVDYSSIPFARPGLFAPSPGALYGGAASGYTPQFGILGTDPNQDGVQAAGHAEALGVPTGTKIALPVLLAVLALAGVTAALVRTWVLRAAPAA